MKKMDMKAAKKAGMCRARISHARHCTRKLKYARITSARSGTAKLGNSKRNSASEEKSLMWRGSSHCACTPRQLIPATVAGWRINGAHHSSDNALCA